MQQENYLVKEEKFYELNPAFFQDFYNKITASLVT